MILAVLALAASVLALALAIDRHRWARTLDTPPIRGKKT